MSPSIAIHPPPPQELPHGSDLVQTSPAGVISPMSAPPFVGVSPVTITPPAVRPTTAPPSSCCFTGGGVGPVSPTTNPQTPATNAVSAQATLTPANVAVPQPQAIHIVAPQPLTPQTVNTGCSLWVDQVIDAAPLSTTPTVVGAAATDSQLPPAGLSNMQTLPPQTVAAPSTPEKLTMAPIPVLIPSPVGTPSHSAIAAVIMSPLLSPPIRAQSAPQIKKQRSWLGRKFSSKTSKVQ